MRWWTALAVWVPMVAAAAPAAPFSLVDGAGRRVSLSDYAGKVVLVDFWATWCTPCKEALPHLQTLDQELGDEFVVLAVSTDSARDKPKVAPYVARSGFTFPVLFDTDNAVLAAYNPARTLPYSVIVGRDGQVAWTHQGYETGDEAEIRAAAMSALGR
jgi:thiol-disulfide isomerase/thioredoxin